MGYVAVRANRDAIEAAEALAGARAAAAPRPLAMRIKEEVDQRSAVKAVVLSAREPSYYQKRGAPNGNELHYGKASAQAAAGQLESLLRLALPEQHFTVMQAKEPEPTVLTIML